MAMGDDKVEIELVRVGWSKLSQPFRRLFKAFATLFKVPQISGELPHLDISRACVSQQSLSTAYLPVVVL